MSLKATLGESRNVYGNIGQKNCGLSAYEIWLGLGNTGSEQDFLDSLKGGSTEGTPGKSAYESWLELGNIGSEADFLLTLKGEKGDTGPAGPQGAQGSTGPQGPQGATGPAGPSGGTGAQGKSAYQIWLELGNSGSEADFIASLKGDKGDKGDKGETGSSGDGSGDMAKAVYDADNDGVVDKAKTADKAMSADNGIRTYDHSKSGTVHNLKGEGRNIKFRATARWEPGDTLTINGEVCRCWNMLTERIESEQIFGFDASVTATLSWATVRNAWNCFFKTGGGLSQKKLLQATAIESDVRKGKTFYAGDKELKTGTYTEPEPAAQGAIGSFTSTYSSVGTNEANVIDVGFRPTVIMCTYLYGNENAHTVVIFDQSKPDTYRLWYGAYVDKEMPRKDKDNFADIKFTDTGFTFWGYYNGSGGKLVNYMCY